MANDDSTASIITPDSSDFQTISVREFSRRIGISYKLSLRMISRGDVPSVACGSRRRIAVSAMARWLGTAAPAGM
jgi:excisionase family DNA binding protein